jgi:hypothetical protein
MALSRSELKDIIKECILEVMLEGIRPNERTAGRHVQESARKPEPVLGKREPQQMGKKHLDSINFSSGAAKVASQAQGRRAPIPAVNELATAFPAEQQDIMKRIFEDTARNTLPAQLTADRSPAAALAQRADDLNGTTNVDPMSAFEGASNWADLAFASSKK